jgi:hypothetical protein
MSTLLGSVAEGANTLHFVVRTTTTVAKETNVRVEVLTLVKEQGAWRVMLPQSLGAVR